MSGCAATTYGVTCPHLKSYTKADQQAAAKELAVAGPHIQRFINDYSALRNAVRACQKLQKKS